MSLTFNLLFAILVEPVAVLVEPVAVLVRRNKSARVTNAGGENYKLYSDDVTFNLSNKPGVI